MALPYSVSKAAPLHGTVIPAEVGVLRGQPLNATCTTGECVSIDGGVRLTG